MIVSEDQSLIISSLGWIEAGGLWVLETSGRVSTHKISDAKYLSLQEGTEGLFSVIHHYDSDQLCISVHSSGDPPKALSKVLFGPLEPNSKATQKHG